MDLIQMAMGATLGLLLGMLLFLEIGRRIGLRHLHHAGGLARGVGTAEGAVFGLLGLLIAFTFSGAASRFEDRRHLITEEANAIGTAYLRLDLLPTASQPSLRQLFRQYTEVRAHVYQDAHDEATVIKRLIQSERLQTQIWQQCLLAAQRPETSNPAMMLLVPALNEMLDITTSRAMAIRNHPPIVVFLLLTILSLIGSMLIGYEMADNPHRSWLHSVAFSVIMSLCIYVIVDLEFPRLGLFTITAADQVLLDLQASMH
jgi:hypothetical protein